MTTNKSLLRVIPWIVAVFSGSAGGAITAGAVTLYADPISVNDIVRAEANITASIDHHNKELERIYTTLSTLDSRQREMNNKITRLDALLSVHTRHDDAKR